MTELDIESVYWAGFIDGEGSIGIARVNATKEGKKVIILVPQFQMSNTDRKILEDFSKWAQMGGIYPSRHENQPNWKPSWNYIVGGLRIKSILIKIFPYLRVKKRQCEIVLEFIKIREEQIKVPIDKIRELKDKGLSLREIGRRFNCSHTFIKKLIELNSDGMKKGVPYDPKLFRLWEEVNRLNKKGSKISGMPTKSSQKRGRGACSTASRPPGLPLCQ